MPATVKPAGSETDAGRVPDWLAYTLLGVAWSPILVLLHELGHALAALALTDGEVSIDMRAAGLRGGVASYSSSSLRNPRAEALIAAAGPAVSLGAASVLFYAWVAKAPGSLILGAGALGAIGLFVASALPVRYGAGLGGRGESDGLVIWRVLTGGPPGGTERDLGRLDKPERAVRPGFALLLAIAGVLALLADPMLALGMGCLFGLAALIQRSERGG
jgi:hypothetical protein